MRVTTFFYDVPKGSKKVKFFREFYGTKQKVNGKNYGGDGFLKDNKILSYKPGDGAIMVSQSFGSKVGRFFRDNTIKNEMFIGNVSSGYYRQKFK